MLAKSVERHSVEAVSHFAGDIVVPESVAAPRSYYRNNTCKTRSLLQACADPHIAPFVFSSTAAVYGQSYSIQVCQAAPTRPANPSGSSKLIVHYPLPETAGHPYKRHYILTHSP